ncbi:type 2 periplasmic-binding domain-containing protein [Haemophilus paraphrohaemolyticus]|nr:hypothetical protein [Haemophilus paraphrohaemolyticus]
MNHRINMGLRIGLEADSKFIVRKITEIGDVLVAAPSLLERLGKPTSLEDLEHSYPFGA